MTKNEILKYLFEHKPEFESRFGAQKIGLFGSYGRDHFAENSDIDIVVELDNTDMFNLIGMKQAIEEDLGAEVDIVRYRDRMNPALKHRIDKEAHYV
jgi:predicted nucleotidyltransferase